MNYLHSSKFISPVICILRLYERLMLSLILKLGQTALHAAAAAGNVDVVKLLLQDKRFTEINTKDDVMEI